MGALLQILFKALLGPSHHDSDTEVEVRAPILCGSTVNVDECGHLDKEEREDEHRGRVGR